MGILFGPTGLDGFRMLIKSLTSMEVTGVRKRELQVLSDRYSRGDLGVFGIVFVISSAIFTKKSLRHLNSKVAKFSKTHCKIWKEFLSTFVRRKESNTFQTAKSRCTIFASFVFR